MTILSNNKKQTSSAASNEPGTSTSQIEQPDQLTNVELTIPADLSEQTGRDTKLTAADDSNTVNIQISNMQNVSEHFTAPFFWLTIWALFEFGH